MGTKELLKRLRVGWPVCSCVERDDDDDDVFYVSLGKLSIRHKPALFLATGSSLTVVVGLVAKIVVAVEGFLQWLVCAQIWGPPQQMMPRGLFLAKDRRLWL